MHIYLDLKCIISNAPKKPYEKLPNLTPRLTTGHTRTQMIIQNYAKYIKGEHLKVDRDLMVSRGGLEPPTPGL